VREERLPASELLNLVGMMKVRVGYVGDSKNSLFTNSLIRVSPTGSSNVNVSRGDPFLSSRDTF
jgi:hypothetical protein